MIYFTLEEKRQLQVSIKRLKALYIVKKEQGASSLLFPDTPFFCYRTVRSDNYCLLTINMPNRNRREPYEVRYNTKGSEHYVG